MDSDPDRNVGRTDLSGELCSVPAPRETDPTPAVTRPGAGPSSAMVTRSRARRGRGMSVEPEIEFRPVVESRQEIEIPAETCEGCLEAARPTTERERERERERRERDNFIRNCNAGIPEGL